VIRIRRGWSTSRQGGAGRAPQAASSRGEHECSGNRRPWRYHAQPSISSISSDQAAWRRAERRARHRPYRDVPKLALVLAAALALTIGASGGASAAAPIENEHTRSTDTIPDDAVCDIPGTSTINIVDNFKLYADGTFRDTARFRQVFTAAESGKSVVIFSAGQVTGLNDPIQNADGTVTFINTFKGLPEKLSIAGGPTLSRDAGVVTVTTTFRPLGDDEFDFVSQTFSGEHGPHPDLESGFEVFCDVLIPALT
jgi:hypothetical protein